MAKKVYEANALIMSGRHHKFKLIRGEIMMKKQVFNLLLLGLLGSAVWLAADIVLGYLPGGIAKSGFMSDENTLAQVLEGAPLWRFTLSTALGTIGLMISVFGYMGIYKLFDEKSKILAKLTILGGVGGSVAGAVYHNICTSSEWYYVKVGGSDRFSILSEYII